MKKRLFAMFLIVFLSLSFSPVLAQEAAKTLFSQMDTNKDGKVSRDEFMTAHMEGARKLREPRFNQLDANRDGIITKDEFMAVHLEEARKINERKFKRIDANKDGVLTEEEVIRRFRLIKDTLKNYQIDLPI